MPAGIIGIDLKNGNGSAGKGNAEKPDVTLELDAELAPVLFGGDVAEVQAPGGIKRYEIVEVRYV